MSTGEPGIHCEYPRSMSFSEPGFLYGQDPSGRDKQQHAKFLLDAANSDGFDDDRFLGNPAEQDEGVGEQHQLPPYEPMYQDDDGQDGRSPSMGSQYTRDSIGNIALRKNEMMKWMDSHPDPQPNHREGRLINPAAAWGIPDVTRPSFQSDRYRDSGTSDGGGEQRRSDRVIGQYRRTFGERMKATGGGIGGFFKALFGRGMRRANIARYGA